MVHTQAQCQRNCVCLTKRICQFIPLVQSFGTLELMCNCDLFSFLCFVLTTIIEISGLFAVLLIFCLSSKVLLILREACILPVIHLQCIFTSRTSDLVGTALYIKRDAFFSLHTYQVCDFAVL